MYKQGTIVSGIDKSYSRSQYEVLADNGFMLLLLFRELNGFVSPKPLNLVIRPKGYFEEVLSSTLSKSENLTLTLPNNWLVDYKDIVLKYNDQEIKVIDIGFD